MSVENKNFARLIETLQSMQTDAPESRDTAAQELVSAVKERLYKTNNISRKAEIDTIAPVVAPREEARRQSNEDRISSYNRVTKEPILGPNTRSNPTVDTAVNAFKAADRTLKKTAAIRADQAEIQQRAVEEQQLERGLDPLQSPDMPQGGMTAINLLIEMLPGITKQVVDLTEALKEQGESIGEDVSKAKADEKRGQEQLEQTKTPTPKFKMSSISPKTKTAAKAAAVVGGVSLAGYMATKGQQGQPGNPLNTSGSLMSSTANTFGEGLSSISESLLGLKPAGNSAHAGQAMAYFMSQGWKKHQAAGIVGNLQQESGASLDPNARNSIGMFGIAQWDTIRRNEFNKIYRKPIYGSTFEEQLIYVQHELTKGARKGAGTRLSQTTDATTASQVVQNFYEGAPGQDDNKRIVNAKYLAGEQINDSSLFGQVSSFAESAYNFVGSELTSLTQPELGTVTTKNGLRTNVAKPFVSNFQGFINDLEGTGYVIKELGGFANRSNVNDPSKRSFHSFGASIDINASSNRNRGTNTDLPPQTLQLARKWGLGWGLMWKSVKDPMHFSIAQFEGGIAPIDRATGQLRGRIAATPASSAPKPEPRAPNNSGWFAQDAWNKSKHARIRYVPIPVPVPTKSPTPPQTKQKAPGASSTGWNPGQLLRMHF